ncbi:MAG: phosphorylase [Planctomycetota bacterium]
MEFWVQRKKGGLALETLLSLADQVAAAARAAGALVSIPTEIKPLGDQGTEFSVRIVGPLARKATPRVTPLSGNPFLPYETALHVADLPPHHVCLLNKFNVVDRHLLVVTRDFASQLEPLNADDFSALAICLAAADGVGFYNGGPAAGASQQHKHLQWIPVPPRDLPLTAQLETRRDAMAVVLARQSTEAGFKMQLDSQPTWPYRHGVAHFAVHEFEDESVCGASTGVVVTPEAAARIGASLERTYRRLLDTCGLVASSHKLPPYNLLVARRWMLLVPRRCEFAAGISLNALAFAGALLVKDREQWETLRKFGPWRALRTIAFEVDGRPIEPDASTE